MNRQLIEDLYQYFKLKENKNGAETDFLNRLTGELSYFQITAVSRADLEAKGFDIDDVDDSTMTTLASKLSDDYCTQLFWFSMESIAEDYCEIPKYKCPKCWKGASQYNPEEKKCRCFSCSHEWELTEPTGRYVLIEYPEDSSFFEEHNIGYPSYNQEDNGARYIPEHIYKAHFNKVPAEDHFFMPIQWPNSQVYFELEDENADEDVFELCEPIIADDEALADFGDSSIWVPLYLINEKQQ